MRLRWLVCCPSLILCCGFAGCGTTRWSDTKRTATEEMLLSDAVERAVSQIDFRLLSGQEVFLDAKYLQPDIPDKEYIVSTLRQHMLASGCILKERREDAAYIAELRAGVMGTDRHDLLLGIPSMTLPQISGPTVMPTSLPEIALAKRTDQQGVAKLAVFAYERATGRPLWQSGNEKVASQARDLWMFGAGPFQNGNIYERTKFAGGAMPLVGDLTPGAPQKTPVGVAREAVFYDRRPLPENEPKPAEEQLPGEQVNTAARRGTWQMY